ncbi:hypothetical protein D3C85_1692850 [compost metagenome]
MLARLNERLAAICASPRMRSRSSDLIKLLAASSASRAAWRTLSRYTSISCCNRASCTRTLLLIWPWSNRFQRKLGPPIRSRLLEVPLSVSVVQTMLPSKVSDG